MFRLRSRRRAQLGERYVFEISHRASDPGFDRVTAVLQEGLPFPAASYRVVWELERRHVETVLAEHGGNVGAAARASGVAHRYFQLVLARGR